MKYDRLYYWVGEWRGIALMLTDDRESLYNEVSKMGYVAVWGKVDIGPPEGPPSAERLASVLALR